MHKKLSTLHRKQGTALALLLLLVLRGLLAVPASWADIVYLYDPLGRLVRVIDQAGEAATYIYDPVGNILQIARQSGIPQDQTSLSGVAPPSGAQGSQVTLTFTGTNLAGASLPALPAGFTLVSIAFSVSGNLDVLTVTLALDPELALGPYSLTLLSALGATLLPFSLNVVLPPPRVDRVIPPIVTMGNLVQVEGNGFDEANPTQNHVTINGVALPLVGVKKTKLIALVLPGVTTGPVTVTTAQGTGVSPTPLTVIPGTHPQQNRVAATLRSPFRAPTRIAVSPDGSRAYILNGRGIDAFGTNRGGNSLTVVDTARHEVVGVIPVGALPTSLALTPDGSRALVVNSGAPLALTVIDTVTLSVVGTVPLPNVARDVVASPDGTRAYVAVDSPAVVVVDLTTLSAAAQIGLAIPVVYLAVSPDGNTVYAIGRTVALIDVPTRQVVRTIPLNIEVVSFALDPVAQRLYVGVFFSTLGLRVLDLTTGTVIQSLPPVGQPTVALSPDRTRLYVIGTDTQLTVRDTATLATVGTVTVGRGHSFVGSSRPFPIQGLLVSADGGTVWVANADDNTVSVVDARALAVAATVPAGIVPQALGLVQSGTSLYVLNHSSNTVSAVETATNTVLPAPLDRFGLSRPLGLVVAPDGSAGYVVNSFVPATTAFDPATGSGLATLSVGDSHVGLHLAVALTRTELYVGNASSPGVAVLDLGTRTQKTLLPLARPPRALALSLDERRLYVATDLNANQVGSQLTTFNATTGALIAQLTLDAKLVTDFMVVNPEGTRLYVLHPTQGSLSSNGLVRVIDTATHTQVATITVGVASVRLTFDRTGRRLYAVNGNSVSVIDPATNQVVATIGLGGGGPTTNLVVSLDGSKAYLGRGIVSVIDTASNTVTAQLNVGGIVRAVALSPDGQRLLATTELAPGKVAVIDTTGDRMIATLTVGTASTGVGGGLLPVNVTFSPDGARAWVVNTVDESISVIE